MDKRGYETYKALGGGQACSNRTLPSTMSDTRDTHGKLLPDLSHKGLADEAGSHDADGDG